MPPHSEEILALRVPRAQLRPVTALRSTWIVSSIRSLREQGHFERYAAQLPAEHRTAILEAVAGIWFPIELVCVHYRACDALGLAADEQFAMGRAVGQRAQGSLLGTVVTMAKSAGATPWTLLAQGDRLWERGFAGGGALIHKLGPKEARIELIGCPLLEIGYARIAFGGIVAGMSELFARRAWVHAEPGVRGPLDSVVYRLQWA